jgi:hypothetical protein
MANPRAQVTIAGIELVADIGSYEPFADVALGVTVLDGVEATTLQDFGMRIERQEGQLVSGTGTSPGLISAATRAALDAAFAVRGAAHALSDSLGNAGTVKPFRWAPRFEYGVPGDQAALYSYTLRWRWLTLTTRNGAPYTGR